MSTLILVSIIIAKMLIFAGYVYFIYKRYGVLGSISASTYSLEGNERYFFTGWLWLLGALTLFLFPILDTFAVFAAMGFGYCGVTVNFRTFKHTYWVHYIGTVGMIVAAYLGFIVLYGLWLPAAVFIAGSIYLYTATRKYIWYVEIWAMVIAVLTMLYLIV